MASYKKLAFCLIIMYCFSVGFQSFHNLKRSRTRDFEAASCILITSFVLLSALYDSIKRKADLM